jgi:RND family efflux transporter MFP subunit
LADVSPRIEGIVEKTHVSPFDWVKAGQLLAEIRSRQFGNPPPLVSLTAPLSGLVIQWNANVGEAVDPSKVLFQIVDPSLLWVEGDVPEQFTAQVKPGQPVRVSVVALPGELFTGKIIRMSGMVEPEKRTVHIWVEVANPKFRLKPEMFAELAVVVGNSSKVLAVPMKAILKSGGETFVFVESGEHYLRQNVVAGVSDDRYVEIKEGLFEGDRVVTQGNYELMSSIFIKGGVGEHTH